MLDIIKYRYVTFIVSGVLFVTSIVLLFVYGLNYGIDFTGGTLAEYHFPNGRPDVAVIEQIVKDAGVAETEVQPAGEQDYLVRMPYLEEATHQKIRENMTASQPGVEEKRFESIGPVIGQELKQKAIVAIILVNFGIIGFIAYAFRKVSRPVASWKYGLAAIIALMHDVTIVTGVFAFLGKFYNVQVDTLFVTALLTVLGYSVMDTIVTFDRIRENLARGSDDTFGKTITHSVNQVFVRSLNTSVTVFLVLLALYLFGGSSIHSFVLALIIGVAIGTYSSLFVASPLLYLFNRRNN